MDKRKRQQGQASDFTQRGYATLHIKKATRQRLNFFVAELRLRDGEFITQDDALNYLLDQHPTPATVSVAVPTPP